MVARGHQPVSSPSAPCLRGLLARPTLRALLRPLMRSPLRPPLRLLRPLALAAPVRSPCSTARTITAEASLTFGAISRPTALRTVVPFSTGSRLTLPPALGNSTSFWLGPTRGSVCGRPLVEGELRVFSFGPPAAAAPSAISAARPPAEALSALRLLASHRPHRLSTASFPPPRLPPLRVRLPHRLPLLLRPPVAAPTTVAAPMKGKSGGWSFWTCAAFFGPS